MDNTRKDCALQDLTLHDATHIAKDRTKWRITARAGCQSAEAPSTSQRQ